MTTFAVSVHGPNCDVRVAGDLDIASADELIERGLLGLQARSVNTLTIEMAAVDFLDSTGIGALVTLRNQAVDLGKDMQLHNVTDRVMKVLKMTGLDTVFSIHREPRSEGDRSEDGVTV